MAGATAPTVPGTPPREDSDSEGDGWLLATKSEPGAGEHISHAPGDSPARSSTFPSELGQPYQRTPQERTPESIQRHADAGERLVRMASKLHSPQHSSLKPQEPGGGAESPRTAAANTLDPKLFVLPPEDGQRAEDEDIRAPPEAGTALPAKDVAGITPGSASTIAPAPADFPDDTVIIFDWDDTLFPTWFVSEVVVPCLPTNTSSDSVLPDDSPFAEALVRHAHIVRQLLSTAREIGRVGIVTLAQRPWVLSSARRFWPGIDFKQILQDLEIPIIYARECLRKPVISQAKEEEGVNIFTIAKQAAMIKVLKKLYGKRPWTNIISIGDSIVERDAITELLWGHDQESDRTPRCKTVKLMEEPSTEQLGAELVLLCKWLRSLASHQEDFDVVMDDSEEMMFKMHERFCR
jgi:hypothetical protein